MPSWQGPRGAVSGVVFHLRAESSQREAPLQPGLGESWLKAGWFVCKAFGLEEENTRSTVNTLSQPCTPASAPAFLAGKGPGAIYAGVPGC